MVLQNFLFIKAKKYIEPRLCGRLSHRRPKMFFGTFSLGKNILKFLSLKPIPLKIWLWQCLDQASTSFASN
jgi:hypothetical protein